MLLENICIADYIVVESDLVELRLSRSARLVAKYFPGSNMRLNE
jgi:hypothetical protein